MTDLSARPSRRLACALLLLFAPAWPACSRQGAPGALSTVLITLDTTRADALGCYGGKPEITPVLDTLAAESVLYEKAYSVAPLTLPSHASMLTGLYPPRHTVRDNGIRALPESARTLAESARAAGYQTAAFIAAVVLAKSFGLGQGFERYDVPAIPPGTRSTHYPSRPAAEVVDAALAWFDQRDRERPFFLWVHLFDPHTPYAPPAAFLERVPADPYLGEVASMDHEIGRLLDALRAEQVIDQCLLLVVGDHGEGRFEHGEDTHGPFCYQSTLRVPLLVRHPGAERGGERSGELVSVVDVQPTLAAAMGLPPAKDIDGLSLYRGQVPPQRGTYFETYYGYFAYGWSPLAGWVDARFKSIFSSEPELYDLLADPGETRNLLREGRDELAGHRRAIAAMAARPVLERGEQSGIDSALRAQIQALGYAASAEAEEEVPHPLAPSELPPPLRSIEDHLRTGSAQEAMSAGDFARTERILRPVVAANPRNYKALALLGLSLAYQERRAEAIEPFRRLVEVGPPRADPCVNLGLCYASTGRIDDALAMYRRALEIDPDHVLALQNLILLLKGIGREADAQPFAEHLRTLTPEQGAASADGG